MTDDANNPFTAAVDPLYATTYGNLTAAHEAIEAAGFSRNSKRHVWQHQDGRTAKAVFKDDAVRREVIVVAAPY